jgi:hypothetical protein
MWYVMARTRRDLGCKPILSGSKPLVDLICKNDIKLVAGNWPWLKNRHQFSDI